jgi:hypothetical protein
LSPPNNQALVETPVADLFATGVFIVPTFYFVIFEKYYSWTLLFCLTAVP